MPALPSITIRFVMWSTRFADGYQRFNPENKLLEPPKNTSHHTLPEGIMEGIYKIQYYYNLLIHVFNAKGQNLCKCYGRLLHKSHGVTSGGQPILAGCGTETGAGAQPLPTGDLWCRSLGHHQFCTTETGRSNPAQCLIPLTKCILLAIGTFLSDRILFTTKLGELLF